MAAQPTTSTPDLHVPEHPVRIVTASALFDGHDASINIMRRIMQAQGAEVIHLGHNRSVQEVVDAAHRGGRAGRRGQLLPGRARRVLRVPRAAAARVGRRPRQGRRRRRRRHRAGRDRAAARARASPSSAPRTASGSGLAGHDQPGRRRPATSTCGTQRADHGGGGPLRRPRSPSPGRSPAAETGHLDDDLRAELQRGRGRAAHPGARHHRHRRLGQVEPHRRAGAPAAASTSRTSCASPCSRSTRPAAAAAAPCSATGSG